VAFGLDDRSWRDGWRTEVEDVVDVTVEALFVVDVLVGDLSFWNDFLLLISSLL
jgi:hypothetical protein